MVTSNKKVLFSKTYKDVLTEVYYLYFFMLILGLKLTNFVRCLKIGAEAVHNYSNLTSRVPFIVPTHASININRINCIIHKNTFTLFTKTSKSLYVLLTKFHIYISVTEKS